MKPAAHRIYIGMMTAVVVAVTAYLLYSGYSYYSTPLEERFYHPDYDNLKPNGLVGHGLGIVGSLSMILGVSIYMLRKRMRSLSRLGKLQHWLEFHIFLCLLGPILVLYHTSFKVGGLVAVSFWSMVAVALSGVIGRFIYIRIPRSIEGRELSLNEVRDMKRDIHKVLSSQYELDDNSLSAITAVTEEHYKDRSGMRIIRRTLRKNKLSRPERNRIMKMVRNEISLNRKIDRLQTMQNLFKYWHVAHLPFALIMLVIMVIHVAVSIVFGYRWIF